MPRGKGDWKRGGNATHTGDPILRTRRKIEASRLTPEDKSHVLTWFKGIVAQCGEDPKQRMLVAAAGIEYRKWVKDDSELDQVESNDPRYDSIDARATRHLDKCTKWLRLAGLTSHQTRRKTAGAFAAPARHDPRSEPGAGDTPIHQEPPLVAAG